MPWHKAVRRRDAVEAPPAGRAPEDSPRERVVRAIVTGLYQGKYRPGDRLVEARLTEEYGVSRGPIREAFNRLSAMGIVTLNPERGAQIRVLTAAEAADILVVVQNLLGLCAQLAAERIHQPGAAKKLRAAQARLLSHNPESRSLEHARARDGLYAVLMEIAGNLEVRRVLATMQTHLIRVQFGPHMQALDRERHEDYRAIAEAVLRADAVAARAAARAHVAHALKAMQKMAKTQRSDDLEC